jgi:hypothetical protein
MTPSALSVRRGASGALLEARVVLRRATASRRPLPSFLIVGAAKAGTTSLHEYLCEHPRVSTPLRKEIHYFDFSYGRGEPWYRAHFDRPRSAGEISGESTPYYLFHPLVPERVARDLPDVKLIVLLRDPIDRAFSQHNHEVSSGYETLPFGEACEREAERLRGEEERMRREPGYSSFSHQHNSYLARSRYAEQLERWYGHFDRDRFLVLGAEELFADPAATLARTQEFLGLDVELPGDLSPRNSRTYAPIDSETRTRLQAELEPHNQRLFELVGREFGWK